MNAIIAVNPQQMQEAQVQTAAWVGKKLASAQSDLGYANDTRAALKRAGLSTLSAEALVKKAKVRIRHYEKVAAALKEGYYIIPPFDIQLFAIRTSRAVSPNQTGTRNWAKEQTPMDLPAGEGFYVNPVVDRMKIGTEKQGSGEQAREVAIFQNANWKDCIDLPVRAMKPQVIEAVGRALELKIFDALGIAPAYRAADPIIAGQIRRPDGRGVVTFFVAWWLDEEDL